MSCTKAVEGGLVYRARPVSLAVPEVGAERREKRERV